VAEASRRAMAVRYSILNYMYTLFYYAHTEGDTVMRALAWEFPNDISLRETFNQFLLGPSILVTPVLTPNVEIVKGVFPGIGQGERWYDWYTLQEVQAQPGENVTLSAPLEHINVHVRGGSISKFRYVMIDKRYANLVLSSPTRTETHYVSYETYSIWSTCSFG